MLQAIDQSLDTRHVGVRSENGNPRVAKVAQHVRSPCLGPTHISDLSQRLARLLYCERNSVASPDIRRNNDTRDCLALSHCPCSQLLDPMLEAVLGIQAGESIEQRF